MTLNHPNWAALETAERREITGTLFEFLQRAAIEVQESDPDDPSVLSVVPRMADLLASRSDLGDFIEPFNTLARSVGLWNYIDKDAADPRERLVAEAVTVSQLGGITLHREQVAALNVLYFWQKPHFERAYKLWQKPPCRCSSAVEQVQARCDRVTHHCPS